MILSYRILGALTLLAAFTCVRVEGQPFTYEFIEHDAGAIGFGESLWADFDRDGDLDLAVSGNRLVLGLFAGRFDVYLNDGDGIRTTEEGGAFPRTDYTRAAVSDGVPVWLSTFAAGDVNGDNIIDLIVAGASTGTMPFEAQSTVYVGNGDGTFARAPSDAVDIHSGALDLADFDNDGDQDLLVTGVDAAGEPTTRIYRNDGSGAFSDSGIDLEGIAYGDAEWIDFDVDGDFDVAVSGRTAAGSFATRLLRNDGSDQFEPLPQGFEDLVFGRVGWADFDLDGDPDLLITGGKIGPFFLAGAAAIYRNTNGSFEEVPAGLTGVVGGPLAWGDHDQDGDSDVLLMGGRHAVGPRIARVFSNRGGGAFEHTLNLGGAMAGSISWSDYDGDGDLDVLASGTDETNQPLLNQYRNSQRLVNTPPTPPENLEVASNGSKLTFSWSPSSDVETPSAGLTYNLRVGTSPRSVDIVTPMADPETGKRFVAANGNTGWSQSWTLEGLGEGTYFWSVQAIDAGYAASRFADEVSFSIRAGALADAPETQDDDQVPVAFGLWQNYPNPFNPVTQIRYSVQEPRHVTIRVYDALGRSLSTLVDDFADTGVHEVTLDASEYASGVYLYRMEAGDFRSIKRFTIVK